MIKKTLRPKERNVPVVQGRLRPLVHIDETVRDYHLGLLNIVLAQKVAVSVGINSSFDTIPERLLLDHMDIVAPVDVGKNVLAAVKTLMVDRHFIRKFFIRNFIWKVGFIP